MMGLSMSALWGGGAATRVRIPSHSHTASVSLPRHLSGYRARLLQSSVCRSCGHVHAARLGGFP